MCLWVVLCGGLLSRGDSQCKGPELNGAGSVCVCLVYSEGVVRVHGSLIGIGAFIPGAMESCRHVAQGPHGNGGHGLGPPSTHTVCLETLVDGPVAVCGRARVWGASWGMAQDWGTLGS